MLNFSAFLCLTKPPWQIDIAPPRVDESHMRAIIFRSLEQNGVRFSSAFSVIFTCSMHRNQGTHSGSLSPSFLFLYNLLGEIKVKPPSCPLLSQQHILSLIEQAFNITESFIFYSRHKNECRVFLLSLLLNRFSRPTVSDSVQPHRR